jgi:hypothetical protein
VCWCDPHTGEIKTQNLFHNAPALKQFSQRDRVKSCGNRFSALAYP